MSDAPKVKPVVTVPPEPPPPGVKPNLTPLPVTTVIDPPGYPDPPSITEHKWRPREYAPAPQLPPTPHPKGDTDAEP